MDSTVFLTAAIAVPFAARYLVAWEVEVRVRGLITANIEPKRQRSDYPPPNEPIRAGLMFVAVLAIAWSLATALDAALSSRIDLRTIAPLLFGLSAFVSLTWAFRRVRADDRRTKALVVERLARYSSVDS